MSGLYEAFAATAARHPDRIAVLGDPAGTLSYAELAAAGHGIAAALVAAGGAPGDRVGLLLDHGVRPVTAIVGALAAGRCYVPLDPTWPAERLAYMCEHAGVSAIVTSGGHRELAGQLTGAPVVAVDDPAAAPRPVGDLGVPTSGRDDPVYILYTSGSTGRPKGVAQSHRGVLHGVGNHVTNLRITQDDRISLLTSFSFDMAVTDLYSALLSGAAVVTVDVRRHGLGHLAAALAERGVTVYHSTPTVYRYLVDTLRSAGPARLPALRVVVLGGEEVTGRDVHAARERFADGCVLVNGYGATEVSFAVQNHVRPGDAVPDGVVPIGRPLAGYEVLLLDPSRPGAPVDEPAGARTEGEIAIRSPYLALGYWRDPERTGQRFSTGSGRSDGGSERGARVYRTGDLGRWLPDGRLVYLGRVDRQVKVRGYRVEPGEVEAQLEALDGVARAVVVVRGEALVAYVQPAAARAAAPQSLTRPGLDPVALQRALARRLPDYLVPGAIVVCERLPLTPTGKVDLLALPDPPGPRAGSPETTPTTPTERVLHDAWCAVLGLPAVGVDDGFFDLGGHSLQLAGVQRHVESALGARVSLVQLLEHPTIRAQAGFLDGTTSTTGGTRRTRAGVLAGIDRRMAARQRRRADRARREDDT